MATNLNLVSSIVNNPSAHLVNRAEKMERTISAMVDNMEKQASHSRGHDANFNNLRGYGEGRNTGD